MSKSVIVFLFILVFTSLNAAPLEKISLQLQWKYQFEFAGFIMAKELGYYEDVGLDVKLIEYDNSNTVEKLLNNEIDYLLDNSSIIHKNKKLEDVTLLATYLQRSPLVFITTPEITNPLDLLGKKIMISENEISNSSLSILLDYYSINSTNTEYIPHTYTLDDFIDKKVDAIAGFRSCELFKLDKRNIKYNIIDPVKYGFSSNAINLFATYNKVKNSPQQIENFLNATKKGWKYAFEHVNETIEIITKKYNSKLTKEALLYEAKVIEELMLLNLYDIGNINNEFIKQLYKQLIIGGKLNKNQNDDRLILKKEIKKRAVLDFTQEEKEFLKTKKFLKICVDPKWKPLEWIDKDLKYRGIGSDYLELLTKEINIPIELYKTKSWAKTLEAIKSKKCDILPMAKKTKDRASYLNFTTPYFYASYVVATTTDKRFMDDIEEKLDESFAVVKGSAIISDLKEKYKNIKIVEVENIYEGIELVQKREVYGFINITAVISYLIQDKSLVDIKIAAKLPLGFELSVASRKDEPLLNTIFTKAINSLTQQDKRIIQNRWTSLVFEQKIDYDLLYKILAFASLILSAFVYKQIVLNKVNKLLTKKVQEKTLELQILNKGLEKKVQQRTAELEHQAFHDALTNLPNRALFNDRLTQGISKAKRNNSSVALFFIDLDRFKHINDSLGHDVGDEVLKIIATRLSSSLREEDTLSRLGGDEFTVIIEKLQDVRYASGLAFKLLKVLEEPILVDGHTLYISSSIGISLYPKDDTDVKNLVKYADAAMYRAKDEGRNNFQFYSKEMTQEAFDRIVMQTTLRQAIDKEEFEVYYQPQIDAKNEKLIGMEALVRWNHPTKGLISPALFIPIAEESNLIIEIDQFVMKSAMNEVSRWHNAGLNPGKLSLNLAVKQLESKDCLTLLQEVMLKHSFKPSWLELEVTESDVMRKPDEAIEKLNKISSFGIDIAIDDFGTGYSSLSYLKRLPIDKLKIDQSFISNLFENEEDSSIVRAIIALAKSLNLSLIAEGVEEIQERDFLLENGCDNIQGYLYAKPMPAKDMEEFIKNFSKE